MKIFGKLIFNSEISSLKKEILVELLHTFYRDGIFPEKIPFLFSYENNRHLIDELKSEQLIYDVDNRLELSIFGLFSLRKEDRDPVIKRCDLILDKLKQRFRQNHDREILIVDLANELTLNIKDVACDFYYLSQLPICRSRTGTPIASFTLNLNVIKFTSFIEGFQDIYKIRFGGYRILEWIKMSFLNTLSFVRRSKKSTWWSIGKDFFGFWNSCLTLIILICGLSGIKTFTAPSAPQAINYADARSSNEANETATPTNYFSLTGASYDTVITLQNQWIAAGSEYMEDDSSGLVEIYDRDSKKIRLEKLSVFRNQMGATSIGNRGYFVGGMTPSGKESTAIDIYDADSNMWSDNLKLTEGRSSPGTTSIGNKLIVAGGFNSQNLVQPNPNAGTNSLDSIEIFNIGSENPKKILHLSIPRAQLAIASSRNKAFIIGGFPCFYGSNPNCEASNTIDILDVTNEKLTTIEMPERRGGHVAYYQNEKLYIAGGGSRKGISTTLDIYDMSKPEPVWKSISMAPPGTGATINGIGPYIIIAGGTSNPNLIQIFDESSGRFRETKVLKEGRYNLSSSVLGKVIFFIGGVGKANPLNTVEFYSLEELVK